MNRLSKEEYDSIPWSQGTGIGFCKPAFEEIHELKLVPFQNRDPRYSEFYELQAYLDLLDEPNRGLMLDAGTGCGSLSYLFSYFNWKVVSCDIDRTAYGLPEGAFVEANIDEMLPFRDGIFDAIVCKQVIEHIESPRHLLREFSRLMKRGRRLVISLPNICSLHSRFKFLRSGQLSFYEGHWDQHRTILVYEQLGVFLTEVGFRDVEYFTNRYEMYNLSSKINGRRMRYLVPLLRVVSKGNMPHCSLFGDIMIISARKG
jgi:SAM-dependent methyltransferase